MSKRNVVIEVINPKQSVSQNGENRLFPYYAGYSARFAESIIDKLNLPQRSVILDPWSGSGTTSIASYKKGYCTLGIDLNPVMVLVAKASFISALDIPSLLPLAHGIINSAKRSAEEFIQKDPLEKWFDASSIVRIRAIENEINRLLISDVIYLDLTKIENNRKVSPLAAFFYVVLFRLTRRLVKDFIGTNPTWLKSAHDADARKKVSFEMLSEMFLNEVCFLSKKDFFVFNSDANRVAIEMGDATKLAMASNSIDAIITSPPYCTRIDYAVATSLELFLLRMPVETYDELRRSLTGTSTVERDVSAPELGWGRTCINFLEAVKSHPSRASGTYYYKNHVQYYRSLYKSVGEASRVCKTGADLVFVVQNSYYKDVLNDLPLILEEMGACFGLEIRERRNFPNVRTMSSRNVKSKKYIKNRRTLESVLIFKKT